MEEIKDLLKKIHLSSREEMQYSIMPLLYEKITAKELLHSDIIASLIDTPSGKKSSTIFLQKFLIEIGVKESYFNDFPGLKVSPENPIEERRRIDILITWDKYAVIIENKLNNATDQTNQLLDYYKSINKNKEVIKIVYLPLYETKKAPSFSEIDQDLVINFYPKNIITWLEKCLEDLPKDEPEHIACRNYLDLLNYINIKNKNIMDARKLQELDNNEIIKVIEISKIVKSIDWDIAKLQTIKSILKKKDNNIEVEPLPYRTGQGYIQVCYSDYTNYWVEIWCTEYFFSLYLVNETKEADNIPEIIKNQGFKHHSFERCNHLYNNEGCFEYPFPSNDNYEKLTSDIIKLLEKSR